MKTPTPPRAVSPGPASSPARAPRRAWRTARRFLPRTLRGRAVAALMALLVLGAGAQQARTVLVAVVTGQDSRVVAASQAHNAAARAATPDCAATWPSGKPAPQASPVQAVGGGYVWAAGAHLCSPSGRYVLAFQGDGDLVTYDRDGAGASSLHPAVKDLAGGQWTRVWETFTAGIGQVGYATRAVFEADGNFVLYDQDGAILRQTGTAGIPTPATAALDDTGNLLITDAAGQVRYTSAGTRETDCWTPGVFACTNGHGGA